MTDLMQTLLRLQSFDFGESEDNDSEKVVAELRSKVPAPILGHYDRLVARGKKGLAAVRNQVCTGCHMRLPIGTINTLMHGGDIQLCDSCGRYLCLVEETSVPVAPPTPPTPAAKPKPAKTKKPRKTKAAPSAS